MRHSSYLITTRSGLEYLRALLIVIRRAVTALANMISHPLVSLPWSPISVTPFQFTDIASPLLQCAYRRTQPPLPSWMTIPYHLCVTCPISPLIYWLCIQIFYSGQSNAISDYQFFALNNALATLQWQPVISTYGVFKPRVFLDDAQSVATIPASLYHFQDSNICTAAASTLSARMVRAIFYP